MINPKFSGKKYRYSYGLGFPTGYLVGAIMKLDVKEKMFVKFWEDPNCRATEPLFIPRPGSIEEDDGVVISVCLGKQHWVEAAGGQQILPMGNGMVLSFRGPT